MEHQHVYDKNGKQLCCTLEEKINQKAEALHPEDGQDHNHDHAPATGGKDRVWYLFLPATLSLVLLLMALAFDNNWVQKPVFFEGSIRLFWYILAYIPVGFPVLKEAWQTMLKGEFFTEFLLMALATIGAFAIGEYPEAVAVMLFYAIGETFQTLAVRRAKGNIKALLDQRPDEVNILENGQIRVVKAAEVGIDAVVQLRPGEKLALDGELLSESASFNTAALTGESKPDTKVRGDAVLAGMINLNSVAQVKVTKAYTDSKLSRILEMVQNATAQKAPTELFIRKFAKYYTPVVVLLAVFICVLPYFIVKDFQFQTWLYRALVFLVISCPCALVISIPLGYFGGIGAASRKGILFKGSNFLDVMAAIKNVVVDKTGTMTEGVFKVQELQLNSGVDRESTLRWVNVLESKSTHPVASAIHSYVGLVDTSIQFDTVEEIAGHGLRAKIGNEEYLVGNFKLLDKFGVAYDFEPSKVVYTLVAIAKNQKYLGHLTISDRIKPDAAKALTQLQKLGVKLTMLSGDKDAVVQHVARSLNIDRAFGDLLPEDKVDKVKELKATGESVAFVGDGVNDAPVVALSDAGIAMGGLGSDATIETADIVIQDDQPSKIPLAIRIGKATKSVVWQNVILAFLVKGIVLILGAGGLATMWEAVFADVGVALLAILNAVRVQRMRF